MRDGYWFVRQVIHDLPGAAPEVGDGDYLLQTSHLNYCLMRFGPHSSMAERYSVLPEPGTKAVGFDVRADIDLFYLGRGSLIV